MLEQFSGELRDISQTNRQLGEKVYAYFKKLGAEPSVCNCFEDPYKRMSIEVELPAYKLPRVNRIDSTLAISGLCDRGWISAGDPP